MNKSTTISALFITTTLAMVLLLAACSPLRLINVATSSAGYVRTKNIPYADSTRQRLDVYVPSVSGSDGAKPVVVFFYGGGWDSGNKGEYVFVGEALTSRGIVAVIPDYRVYPEVRFPDFVADGARAMRWVKDNAARFGGDPSRIYVVGHSAGAHIAALLVLDAEYLRVVGMRPQELRGMIGLAGPYDFLPLKSETLKIIFGPEAQRWRSQPINFVDGNNPPMLLLTGTADKRVDPGNSTRLANKIRAHGGTVTTAAYAGLDHSDILVQLSKLLRGDGRVLEDVVSVVLGGPLSSP